MSTITLTGNMFSRSMGVGGFFDLGQAFSNLKQTASSLTTQLNTLKNKIDVASTVATVDTSTQQVSNSESREETKKSSLSLVYEKLDEFIANVDDVDDKVSTKVEELKDDFYSKYSYLKPESEKGFWERVGDGAKALWDGLCDIGNAIANFVVDVVEWCKEHWKLVVTAVLVIVAVVLICTGVGGPFAMIIAGICKGLITGAITGGLIGGFSNLASGESFLEGFENGAFSGALTGALFGGLGGLGQTLGSSCKVLNFLGTAAKAIPVISKISGAISMGFAGFDLLAFGIGLFNPDNFLVKLNSYLHSSQLYNGIQIGVSAIATFTGGFTQGMKNPTCFVAGTMILTATGLVAIENIKAGDIVISTDPDTMETAEKRVVETYIREDLKLIHIVVNGEEIVTTETHPFYVNNRGFVEAGELKVGDELLDVNNNILVIEDYAVVLMEEPTTVFNFQVEDFHTYYVGEGYLWVHNAGTDYSGNKSDIIRENYQNGKEFEQQKFPELKAAHPEAEAQISVKPMGSDGVVLKNGGNYLDGIAIDANGKPFIIEYKLTSTAPYTYNQTANGFAAGVLNKDMIVTGSGQGIFSTGYIVPAGTPVITIRGN